MKISEVIKNLEELLNTEGDLEVTLPQVGDNPEVKWNAQISDIATEIDEKTETLVVTIF